MPSSVNASTAEFCYIDLDFNDSRAKLARCAAFVAATDSRYGFSSNDLRLLGGSELSRIPDLFQVDHEWSGKGAIEVKPPLAGNRIVVKLYWIVAPLACENFATLCWNGSQGKPAPTGESGKAMTYRGSNVHRIQSDFVLQAGDFVKGNGSAGESIFSGKKFKDERPGLLLNHDSKGVLSMGNSGKNSNSSQFFITFAAAPQCNGKHVVFGEVVSGFSVLDYATTFATKDGTPTVPVTITDCGLYTPFKTPGAGYWFDQPDDEAYSGVSPIFVQRPRVAVVAPSGAVIARFVKALGSLCDIVAHLCTDQKGNAVSKEMFQLLENFGADVILVAPACVSLIADFTLPPKWSSLEESKVILEAKYVEALEVIRTRSWLSGESKLDGAAVCH
jgi:cyclophilin family peptidyl-prolyl cis-trans isomerase